MASGCTPWLDLNRCPEPEDTGNHRSAETNDREGSGECSCSGSTASLGSCSASILSQSGSPTTRRRRRGIRGGGAGSGDTSAATVAGEGPVCRSRCRQRNTFEKDCCNSGRNEEHCLSNSGKRRRVSALHKLSERMRRERFNQKIMILKKIVPCSSKGDMVSILDGAIDHLKQLQAQHQMLSYLRNCYKNTTLPQQFLVPTTLMTWPVQLNQTARFNIHLSSPVIYFPSFYSLAACVAQGNDTSSPGFMYPLINPVTLNTNQAEVRC